MKKVDTSQKLPIKMWLDDLEKSALKQAHNLANLPFAFKHIALMPDAHMGYGMPIGGVLATHGVIVPYAVGSDIGCGVTCYQLPLKEISAEQIRSVFEGIRERVPVGKNHHSYPQSDSLMPSTEHPTDYLPVVESQFQSALKQLGTLGGGNHFIEIQKGSDGFIYLMIHSGSRNLGYKVANHYNWIAKEMNAKWYNLQFMDNGLAFLPVDSDEGQVYLKEMNYCIGFAKVSRALILKNCIKVFMGQGFMGAEICHTVDVTHNYASLENHFGQDVWVHRKGAVKAAEGDIVVIPGSQGTPSYLGFGKGDRDSFNSCSHGAGRAMSSTKARESLNLDVEIARMGKIVHSIKGKSSLSEAIGAYKDIDTVMANQDDLVEIEVKLTPLGVLKG